MRGSSRNRWLRLFALAAVVYGVWIAGFADRTIDVSSIPGHEMGGTVELKLAGKPPLHGQSTAVICERWPPDNLISNFRSPNVGSLEGGTIWIVLRWQPMGPEGVVVLAIGRADPGASPYEPSGEYGGVVSDDLVQYSADRSTGSLTFRLPLAKGDPFSSDADVDSISGALTWACGEVGSGSQSLPERSAVLVHPREGELTARWTRSVSRNPIQALTTVDFDDVDVPAPLGSKR